jgi:hypothetical protein
MAALYALSRSKKSTLDVNAVCGYDSGFVVFGCPAILFGQGLQGVLSKWDEYAGAELQQKTDDILGNLSAKICQSLVPAMSTYTVERVVQLTALYSDNDEVKYESIGSGRSVAAYGGQQCACGNPAQLRGTSRFALISVDTQSRGCKERKQCRSLSAEQSALRS